MFTADVIVFGASRGIGLGFSRHYAEAGQSVIATYRGDRAAEQLQSLANKYENIRLYSLDVTEKASVLKFAEKVASVKIIILNAGVKGYSGRGIQPQEHTPEQLENAFKVNLFAHDNIMRAFFTHISTQKDAIAVYIGSKVGQTSDNTSGGSHPYRITKAAGHAMIRNWDLALRKKWLETYPDDAAHTPCGVAICPGWVKTDMGGDDARLTVDESVSQMKKVIEQLLVTKKSDGLYMYDGSISEAYKT